MQFDEDFEIDFRPAVPATVRSKLTQLLRSTTRIVVDHVPAPGKTAKINAIRFTNKPGQYPKEGVEEIAEAVTAIMHIAWQEQETEDTDIGLPQMEFTITAEHKKGNKRQRSQFTYVYKGDDEPDYVEETMSIEDRGVMRVLELQERALLQREATIADAHERFLRVVEQNTAQAAAGSQVMEHAIPVLLAGVQGQLNAKAMEYNTESLAVKEKATTDRMMAALATVAPFIGIGLQQFLANKLGIPIEVLQQGMPGTPGPPGSPAGAPGGAPAGSNGRDPHPSSPHQPRQPAEEPANEDGVVDMRPVNPLAELGNFFGDGLGVVQRRDMNRMLTKKQQSLFDDLFCASTDAEALAAYVVVKEQAASKLGELQQVLNPDQLQLLMTFIQGAEGMLAAPPPG